jgi:hypothetical protein
MATDKEQSVLDIDTVVERLHVRIDGVPHLLSHPNALSLQGHLRMEKIGPRMGELLIASAQRELTGDEAEELDHLLKEGCRLVLEAPDSVHAKLRDTHRVLILQVFTQLQSRLATGVGQTTTPARTGAKSSRGSRGSTRAALRPTG